jgi:DNA-binding PadR family transcriptional regulator
MPRVKDPLTLEYALLGFIQAEPVHAYELHQRLEQTEMLGLVWRLKQRQLYALLERLETEGYLESTTELQENRPPRRMLHLTLTGAAAFQRWLTTPVEHGRDFRQEFMAKLYFARGEGPTTVAHLIDQQRATCQRGITTFNQQLIATPKERVLDALVFHFRIGQLEAILQWLDTCARSVGQPIRPD